MIGFDTRDLERAAKRMKARADQMPFALAGAMNASAEVARRTLIEQTWPEHVEARNRNFLKAALTSKGERATKRRLRVVVYDRLGRGSLRLHDDGGAKRPRGRTIAVPSVALKARRSGKGVPKGLRPRAVPNSFRAPGKFGTGVILQRTGTYTKATDTTPAVDHRHLKVMYGLRSSVPIKADVPFHADFRRSFRRAMPLQFRVALQRAMATARKT